MAKSKFLPRGLSITKFSLLIALILIAIALLVWKEKGHAPVADMPAHSDNQELSFHGVLDFNTILDIKLSADRRTLQILGPSIDQTITSDEEFRKGHFTEAHPLTEDESSDMNLASIDEYDDINFDGYNDLWLTLHEGFGFDGTNVFIIYIYNPKTRTFDFYRDLYKIQNVYADASIKRIVQFSTLGNCGDRICGAINEQFVWKERLVKVRSEVCALEEGWEQKSAPKYYESIMILNEKGQFATTTSKVLDDKLGEEICSGLIPF